MKFLNGIILFVAMALSFAATAEEGQIVVGVNGMTCSSCVKSVKGQLEALKKQKYAGQIDSIVVNLNEADKGKSTATITTVKAAKLDDKQMAQLKKDIA